MGPFTARHTGGPSVVQGSREDTLPGVRERDLELYRSVQVLPELRSVSVDRIRANRDTLTVALGAKWDLDPTTALPGNVVFMSRQACLRWIARHECDVVELAEPLFMREAPWTLAFAIATKLGSRMRRQRARVVAYAIENNDLEALIGIPWLRRPFVSAAGRAYGAVVSLVTDRLVFGTEGAAASYHSLGNHGLFADAPRVLALQSAGPAAERDAGTSAIFVGELAPRKGVTELLRAWELVEGELPDAKLTLVGGGPLADQVDAWAARSADSRRSPGLLPHPDVISAVRRSTVLVAPSRREGRWREQVGLPIVEGLSAGLTVVTTTETGLADWLHQNGHRVIDAPPRPEDLAKKLIDALRSPLPRDAVQRTLPEVAGRQRAHDILHKPGVGREDKRRVS